MTKLVGVRRDPLNSVWFISYCVKGLKPKAFLKLRGDVSLSQYAALIRMPCSNRFICVFRWLSTCCQRYLGYSSSVLTISSHHCSQECIHFYRQGPCSIAAHESHRKRLHSELRCLPALLMSLQTLLYPGSPQSSAPCWCMRAGDKPPVKNEKRYLEITISLL